jgi:hypothetical protein
MSENERSLAEEITVGFDALKRMRELEARITKPLSDEEINKILESLDVYIDTHAGVKLFARAIEKAHGIL